MSITLNLVQMGAVISGSVLFSLGALGWLLTKMVNRQSPGTTSGCGMILLLFCFWIPAIAIFALAFTA